MGILRSRPAEYNVLELIGEGSCGEVYRAEKRDEEFGLKQTVAIKILKSKNEVDIWRGELEKLLKVRSLHCAQLIGWESFSGFPALIIECIKGVTLKELTQCYELTGEELQEVVSQICLGLLDLEKSGISHGDLSPSNIMINDLGEIKLVDFGLHLVDSTVVTPEYAAPEVLSGAQSTLSSDLYSLGKILSAISSVYNPSKEFDLSSWLEPDPHKRCIPSVMHQSEKAQQALEVKVRSILKRGRLSGLVTQRLKKRGLKATRLQLPLFNLFKNLNIQKLLLRPVLPLSFAIVFLSGDASPKVESLAAHVQIRTLNWYEVKLDGKSLGITPLEFSAPVGRPIQLSWRSHDKIGERTLTLQRAHHIVLTDGFFEQ